MFCIMLPPLLSQKSTSSIEGTYLCEPGACAASMALPGSVGSHSLAFRQIG